MALLSLKLLDTLKFNTVVGCSPCLNLYLLSSQLSAISDVIRLDVIGHEWIFT